MKTHKMLKNKIRCYFTLLYLINVIFISCNETNSDVDTLIDTLLVQTNTISLDSLANDVLFEYNEGKNELKEIKLSSLEFSKDTKAYIPPEITPKIVEITNLFRNLTKLGTPVQPRMPCCALDSEYSDVTYLLSIYLCSPAELTTQDGSSQPDKKFPPEVGQFNESNSNLNNKFPPEVGQFNVGTIGDKIDRDRIDNCRIVYKKVIMKAYCTSCGSSAHCTGFFVYGGVWYSITFNSLPDNGILVSRTDSSIPCGNCGCFTLPSGEVNCSCKYSLCCGTLDNSSSAATSNIN